MIEGRGSSGPGSQENLVIREIGFDPKVIAEVLRAKSERPSKRMIQEAAAVGIDLKGENVWTIFLLDSFRGVEGHLMLYPDKKEAVFHTRVRVKVPLLIDSSLGFQRINNVTRVSAIQFFGHVWFENEAMQLHVYHDCQHNYIPK